MVKRTVEELLSAARESLDRVPASVLRAEQEADALGVDIRPVEQRWRDGELPGAVVIDRNVLEWRLDPAYADSIPQTGYDRRVIVVCNEGYGSSLAAATLRTLGLYRATDLIGGYQAWLAYQTDSESGQAGGVNTMASMQQGSPARTGHWNGVYARKDLTQVSWYQPDPRMSVELISELAPDATAAIVDIGGGTSYLPEALLARGYSDLTVLDVSGVSLDVARRRLGEQANDVHWIAADILTWVPPRHYALWHDRAVFHFLTDPAARDQYRHTLAEAVPPGGHAIIATFAPHGPTSCSGLPTVRYSSDELRAVFAPEFEITTSRAEEHTTPTGVVQPFTWVALRRQ